jgi:hypothetical protein
VSEVPDVCQGYAKGRPKVADIWPRSLQDSSGVAKVVEVCKRWLKSALYDYEVA